MVMFEVQNKSCCPELFDCFTVYFRQTKLPSKFSDINRQTHCISLTLIYPDFDHFMLPPDRQFILLCPLSCLQVCPMNTSPHVDPQKSGHEVWEEFSHSFTPAVREVVEFAKKIPGFRDLSQPDQVSLLKAGTFEVHYVFLNHVIFFSCHGKLRLWQVSED